MENQPNIDDRTIPSVFAERHVRRVDGCDVLIVPVPAIIPYSLWGGANVFLGTEPKQEAFLGLLCWEPGRYATVPSTGRRAEHSRLDDALVALTDHLDHSTGTWADRAAQHKRRKR